MTINCDDNGVTYDIACGSGECMYLTLDNNTRCTFDITFKLRLYQ